LAANDYITLQFYTGHVDRDVVSVTLTIEKIGP